MHSTGLHLLPENLFLRAAYTLYAFGTGLGIGALVLRILGFRIIAGVGSVLMTILFTLGLAFILRYFRDKGSTERFYRSQYRKRFQDALHLDH